MKIIRIKSEKYQKTSVNFGGFIMNFNKMGIAEVELREEDEEEKLNNVIQQYSNFICYLDEVSNRELEAKKNQDVVYLEKVIEDLRKEKEVLRISNENLAAENVALKAELKVYREQRAFEKDKEENKESKNKESKNKEVEGEKQQEVVEGEKIEEDIVKIELNKKTVSELKNILSDIFGEDKEEWKSLVKKEDIVEYIYKKQVE